MPSLRGTSRHAFSRQAGIRRVVRGHLSRVGGWLEVDHDMMEEVRIRINSFSQHAGHYRLSPDMADPYLRGWLFHEEEVGSSRSIFNGQEVRTNDLHFIDDLVREIGEKLVRKVGRYTHWPRGLFHIDDEDEERTTIWLIANGSVRKEEGPFLFTA